MPKRKTGTRKPQVKPGRIRISNHSLKHAGINKGDLVVIDLGKMPKQGCLCAAFTAWGALVVKYFHRTEDGNIRLSTGVTGEVIQIFAPRAVMIFGRVVRIEKGARAMKDHGQHGKGRRRQ
jgi:SOS-response transcriptional repressor LexA